MNAKEYREHLHRQRSHPSASAPSLHASDSFSALYLSLFAFLAGEYFAEIRYEKLPSGIFFPVGFLFFWAFYYTYVQPGYLEQRLSSDKKWDLFGVPNTILSSCIWFVKIIFVELTENVISALLGTKTHKPAAKAKPSKAAESNRTQSQQAKRPSSPHSQSHSQSQARPTSSFQSNGLPREINNALQILGVPNIRDWGIIQKRYRELAKQYHPDLNPETTRHGNRFMIYDAAYRRLEAVKNQYFVVEKKRP